MLTSTQNTHSSLPWIPSSEEPVSSVFRFNVEKFGFALLDAEQHLKEKTVGLVTIDQERGDHYRENVLPYIIGVHELREKFSSTIEELADKARNPHELMVFLTALAPLAARTSKKTVGALHDPDTGRLRIEWNGLCHGLPLSAEFFEKIEGQPRGIYLWCAERVVLLEELQEEANLGLFFDVSNHRPVSRDKMIKTAQELTERTIHKMLVNPGLSQNDLYSTQYTCLPCAEFIAPMTNNGQRRSVIHNIYARHIPEYDNEINRNPDRQTNSSETVFAEAGRAMILLDYEAPYKCPYGCACG
jgi:hypothetical protein